MALRSRPKASPVEHEVPERPATRQKTGRHEINPGYSSRRRLTLAVKKVQMDSPGSQPLPLSDDEFAFSPPFSAYERFDRGRALRWQRQNTLCVKLGRARSHAICPDLQRCLSIRKNRSRAQPVGGPGAGICTAVGSSSVHTAPRNRAPAYRRNARDFSDLRSRL